MSDQEDYEKIVQGFADGLFVPAWADMWENAAEVDKHVTIPWGPGSELTDAAPDTPEAVVKIARDVLGKIATRNGGVDLVERFYENEAIEDEHTEVPTLWDFGWYLATEWRGIGVSWGDSHPDHNLDLGYGEFLIETDTPGDASTWEYFAS